MVSEAPPTGLLNAESFPVDPSHPLDEVGFDDAPHKRIPLLPEAGVHSP